MGLKNPIRKLLRRQVDRFPHFGGGIAHTPRLSQGHAAVEIGPCVLWGTLLGAIEDFYRFEKTSLLQELDALREPRFERISARLGRGRAAGRWGPELVNERD